MKLIIKSNIETNISDISKDFKIKKRPELISETITSEVKSWDKLWTVIKNHYNLNSNIEIYKINWSNWLSNWSKTEK